MKLTNFDKTQHAELSSWFENDEQTNHDKYIREVIRYPLLKKQMGLDFLDTTNMWVADIGCGPFNGVSSIMKTKKTTRIDPLGNEYAKHYPQINMLPLKAEMIKSELAKYDLIIITNALDHFEDPEGFLSDLVTYTKPGTFFAHLHAINNAYSHKHEAHAHNVNPELIHQYLNDDFETCWELLDITYSWRKQPAFSQLLRKTTGYKGGEK